MLRVGSGHRVLVPYNPQRFGPLDISSAAAAAAFSLRRLRKGYKGACIRIRRSSDNAQQDIGFTAGGGINLSAAIGFIGAGSGLIAKWYDQSGNGNDLAQATAGNQPTFASSVAALGGKPGVLFGEAGITALSVASTSAIDNMFAAGGYWNAVVNINAAATQVDRIVSKGVNIVEWRFHGAASLATDLVQAATGSGTWTSNTTLSQAAHQIDIQYSSALLANVPTMTFDRTAQTNIGVTQPTGTITTDAGSALFLGNSSALTRGFPGHIAEVICWKTNVPSAGQITTLRSNQKAYWGTP